MKGKWWGRSLLSLMIASQSMWSVGSAEAPVPSVSTPDQPVMAPVVMDEALLYSGDAGVAAKAMSRSGAAEANGASRAKNDAPATGRAESARSDQPVAVIDRTTEKQAEAMVQRLATLSDFAQWKQGQAVRVRTLYSPEGKPHAQLWAVQQGKEALGYLVTTLDGTQVLEFSRRAVPELPANLQGHVLESGYVYAGPLLHLVYVRQNGTLQLCNLSTGEQVPNGELQNLLPSIGGGSDAGAQQQQQAPQREQTVAASASPSDDALYAVGLYGSAQNQAKQEGATKIGVPSLQQYVQGNTWKQPAFAVFDAVQESYRMALSIEKIAEQGGQTFVALQEPFARQELGAAPVPAVYIDSRFRVNAVVLHTSSGR
jgi:hypothetical protein